MPEIHIEDTTALTSVLPTDILNIQRLTTEWNNYRATIGSIFGVPVQIFEQDFTFAELDPGSPPVEVLPDPGASNVYFVTKAWARYNPGPGPGGQKIKVVGHWFQPTTDFSALLQTIAGGSAAAMYWGGDTNGYFVDRNIRFVVETQVPAGNLPSGDGTITIHIEYAVVAL